MEQDENTQGCPACDWVRGILCVDCYEAADDDRLPLTYAEYVSRAAGYPQVRTRRRRLGVILTGVVLAIGVTGVASATDADRQVRAELAELKERRDRVDSVFQSLRDARRCAEGPLPSDLSGALERAVRGEPATSCLVFEP